MEICFRNGGNGFMGLENRNCDKKIRNKLIFLLAKTKESNRLLMVKKM